MEKFPGAENVVAFFTGSDVIERFYEWKMTFRMTTTDLTSMNWQVVNSCGCVIVWLFDNKQRPVTILDICSCTPMSNRWNNDSIQYVGNKTFVKISSNSADSRLALDNFSYLFSFNIFLEIIEKAILNFVRICASDATNADQNDRVANTVRIFR